MRLEPTWKNNRGGDQAISKRLDIFLISEGMFQDQLVLKSTVEIAGLSYRRMTALSITILEEKPPSPFKFNPVWLEHEDYREMVKENWNPLENQSSESCTYQMNENLTTIKKLLK